MIRLSAMRGVPKDAANARTKQVGSDANVYLPLWTRAACPSLCARRSHCPALLMCSSDWDDVCTAVVLLSVVKIKNKNERMKCKNEGVNGLIPAFYLNRCCYVDINVLTSVPVGAGVVSKETRRPPSTHAASHVQSPCHRLPHER